jgi:hypothetical protein
MIRRLVATVVVALVPLCGSAAIAQDAPASDPPAHISLVDGQAVLERDGRTDASPASMPLLAGDRLRTQVGRVEVLFADGSTLHLDTHTVADVQSDEVLRLLEGRIRLAFASTSISTLRSSSAPLRSLARNFSRVAARSSARAAGSSRSRSSPSSSPSSPRWS